MSNFSPIQQTFCINLASRADRWQEVSNEVLMHGIAMQRIEACTPDKAIENSPFVAFNTSQKMALESITKYPAMILEDDCVFMNSDHLPAAMNELPEDWEILYGGANVIGIDTIQFELPVRYSDHLFTLKDAWMTHCMIYSERGVKRILESFSVTCGFNMDEWLRKNIMPSGRCFIIAPQIAYQRPSFSNIWNCDTNFKHLFEQGNKILL